MKRKRINILFTTLNILVIAGMFIHMAIAYINFSKDANGSYVPVDIVFMWSLAYIIPLLLLNLIWDLVRKLAGKKRGQADSPSADVLARAATRSKIVNIVFLVLNAVIVVIIFLGLFDLIITSYGVPLITLNTAWCVIHMNIKKTD